MQSPFGVKNVPAGHSRIGIATILLGAGKLGKVFFFVDELNPEDDEIPEPFCFDRLKSLKSKN